MRCRLALSVVLVVGVVGCESPSSEGPIWPAGAAPSSEPPLMQATPQPGAEPWNWSECGTIEPAPRRPMLVEFALGAEGAVVAYTDGSATLFRVGEATGRELRAASATASAPIPPVSPDGLLSAELGDDAIRLRNLTDFTTSSIPYDASQCGARLSFAPDGKHLLLSGVGICVVDIKDGTIVTHVAQSSLFAGVGGGHVVVQTGDDQLTTFAADGSTLSTIAMPVTAELNFRELSPTGELAALCDNGEEGCGMYDTATGTLRFGIPDARADDPPIFSADGQLVSALRSVYRVKDGSVLRAISEDAYYPRPQALSVDGGRVARIGGYSPNQWAELREVESGAGVQVFGGPARSVLGIAVSPDGGSMFVTTGEGALAYRLAPRFQDSLAIWSGHTGLEMLSEYSRDGSLLAISGDGRAVFTSDTGLRLLAPPPPAGLVPDCYNAYFGLSSNGKLAAGGDYDFHMTVYDVMNQASLVTLPSTSCNASATFSPDDSLLATSAGELYRTQDWTPVWPAPPASAPAVSADAPIPESLTRVQFMHNGAGFVASSCAGDSTLKSLLCSSTVYTVDGGGAPAGGVQGRTVPSLSPGGTLLSFGAVVGQLVSGDHFELSPSQGQLSATAFAPNGDILAGDSDGRLHRFCAQR